jgi:cholesterol transport system auxiliary component
MVGKLQGPTTDFANNGLPQITAAVDQLQNAAESLERLTNDIQSSPAASSARPRRRNSRCRNDPTEHPPRALLALSEWAAAAACALPGAQRLHLAAAEDQAGAPLHGSGHGRSAPGPGGAAASDVGVFRATGLFQRESAGDRLLGITGDKAAYIAETRWVAAGRGPVRQAVAAAFDGSRRARCGWSPAASRAALPMRCASTSATSRPYATTPAPRRPRPSWCEIRAVTTLVSDKDKGVAGEQIFEANRVKAGDNKVGAIVPAYDKAINEALGKIVAWVSAAGTGLPAG